jgi:hypothetical protein
MTVRPTTLRWLMPSAVVLTGVTAIALTSSRDALGERRGTESTVTGQIQAAGPKIFKARGTASPDLKRGPRPGGPGARDMTFSEYTKLSDQLTKAGGKTVVVTPVNRYIKLTPAIPHISGKGFVNYWSSFLVDTNENYVAFTPSANPPTLVLSVYSPANKKYAVDLVIGAAQEDAGGSHAFSIMSGGTDVTVERVKGGSQHVLFELDANSEGWYTFQVTNTGGAFAWSFVSCDILNI